MNRMSGNAIGKRKNRVDGNKKVTGSANYSADQKVDNLKYGYIINSSIAKGRIVYLNDNDAREISGVIEIFSHLNLPEKLKKNADFSDPLAPPGDPFKPLFSKEIIFSHQPIAMVVADSFETARYAAALIKIEYKEESAPSTNLKENLNLATDKNILEPPPSRGNAEEKFSDADIVIEEKYNIPREYHNPMETFATIATWNDNDNSFTIFDKIQGVASSKKYICNVFDLKPKQVKVLSPFVGGGFGSGLRPQYQLFFAALAAKELKATIKVVMTREQMFSFGHRPASHQQIKMGCDNNGKLIAISHKAFCETSKFEAFSETVVDWTGLMYQCEDVDLDYKLVPLDNYTPLDMRAPGGVSGMFALETAIDELAAKAGIDPLQFRLINYADRDQNEDKPFSSKELKACYKKAAEEFGWDKRNNEPKQIKNDHQLIGYGMATGVWEAMQQAASAKAVYNKDGTLTVSSATADIGTGTYTVMAQIAADCFGLPLNKVSFDLGDSDLPESPIEGGSWTVSSVGSAVKKACDELKNVIYGNLKFQHHDKFKDIEFNTINFKDGNIIDADGKKYSYQSILDKSGEDEFSIEIDCKPKDKRDDYSCYTHSCVMVEVNVDEDLGMITVPRIVATVAGGKIINPKTAESQILGGLTWGISMALEEEGMMDDRFGRIMNPNLAEYHVAVQADVQEMNVFFVDEEDDIVNPLGAKGLGEIGLVGVAAAISNAIYNATGKRVRDLPITLDKVLFST